ESFSALSGSQWFSVMDLKSGYYQIEMEESDKPKTAFVCPLGFWEWNRLPQGITNAPSTFQRSMEKCIGDIHLREVLVFLDDLIVFSKSLEELEARLINVLNRLREIGLKLSPEKCWFFQTSVRYLGHIVSRNRVKTDPEKVKALKTWPRPQTLKELKSFLGFSGYYRRFVQDYAKIVKPLTNLTAGYAPTQKVTKIAKPDAKYYNPKEPFREIWTPACQKAFEEIIEKLTSSPVLGFANSKLPYVLHTDASTTGLGAALYQEQDGQSRVTAYATTAAPPDPGPPVWLKTLLDHQAQQHQQLVTPILQHVAAEQKSTTRAGPSNLGQYPGAVPPQSSSQVTQGQPSARTDGPFATELEVIRQRSHNTGPFNILSLHDPAVRRREEQVPQRPASAHMGSHDPYGTSSDNGNRQDMVRHLPNEACKIKLATYDGQED
ncbi:hypothetical protein L3Q82_025684, partial [Scortum barcoo]